MGNSTVSVWILGDQLLAHHPALMAACDHFPRAQVRIVMVESAGRLRKLAYQRKKLVLILSAMRHYAQELRAQGYSVDYIHAESVVEGLRAHVTRHAPQRLYTMAAAEYPGRQLQQRHLAARLDCPVTVVENTQFLVGRYDPYPRPEEGKRVIMEHFYRAMRRHFDLLITPENEPVGGQWNFDKSNRKPLPAKGLHPRAPLTFEPDAETRTVMAEVAALEPAVGTVDGFNLAVTRTQAQDAFRDFLLHRLPQFGPYEDAMSRDNGILFHSLLSPYMNIGLLDPLEMARAAVEVYTAGDAPIHSVEGFVRQVVGWREYIYWHYWQQMPGLHSANHWQHQRAMPRFFWDADTDMACLRHVVQRVIDSGYCHHIERLMVICNFCMLAGIDPQLVNRWFWAFYVDAYDWVVTPNVIGMGLNADGGRTATKPYVASANYINKMSNYCAACRYDPKARTGDDACPFNTLYWNFLLNHEEVLRSNPRAGRAVLGLRHLDEAERARVKSEAAALLAAMTRDSAS